MCNNIRVAYVLHYADKPYEYKSNRNKSIVIEYHTSIYNNVEYMNMDLSNYRVLRR